MNYLAFPPVPYIRHFIFIVDAKLANNFRYDSDNKICNLTNKLIDSEVNRLNIYSTHSVVTGRQLVPN